MKSNLKETDYELLKDEALQCNIETSLETYIFNERIYPSKFDK